MKPGRGDSLIRHPPFGCCGNVDIRGGNGHGRDGLQLRVCMDHVDINVIMQQADENVAVPDGIQQLVLGHDVERIGIPLDLRPAAHAFHRARRDRLRDENPGTHQAREFVSRPMELRRESRSVSREPA